MDDKLTKAVRKARRVGIANKIEGIKTIRTAYPEIGLFEAKRFFDLVTGEWSHIAAVNIVALWCEKHWDDRLNCDCSLGMATAPGASTASEGSPTRTPDELTGKSGSAPKPKSWYAPGSIFPNQETADYWMAELKRDPANWHRRLLAAAGVSE